MNRTMTWGVTMAMGAALAGCGVPGAEEFTTSPEPSTASVSGVTHSFASALAVIDAPLARVSVCAVGSDGAERCTTSALDGSWHLDGVPRSARLVLTFDQDGFVPMLRVVAATEKTLSLSDAESGLMSVANAGALVGTGTSSGGKVWFAAPAGEQGAAMISASLSPSVGTVHYLRNDGTPIAGAASGTLGMVADVEAGAYVLRFSGAACAGADDSSASSVVVRDGYVTGPVLAACNGEH